MNKKLIRLTESDLHRIVKESVNRMLKEYKNDSTRFYNDALDDYLSNGYDEDDAKYHAMWRAIDRGEHKNYMRHYGDGHQTEDDKATERAINNFMLDKNDEWWRKGKNKIVTVHRTDNDGNEWDEDFVEEYPCNYKPSPKVLKKYMAKHNRPLDTRYGIERHGLPR